jgi:hypothetical protein
MAYSLLSQADVERFRVSPDIGLTYVASSALVSNGVVWNAPI